MQNIYNSDLAYIQSVGFVASASGAVPEILRLLRTARIKVRRVIDVGCGSGPLTKVLTDQGFEVTGIDGSAELLKIAREAVPTAHFVHANLYEADLGPCEAIVAINEPLTYHSASDDAENSVRNFFKRAANTLPDGGVLIFDVVELGEPSLLGRYWASGKDWAVLVETAEDQSNRQLVREIEIFRRVGLSYRRSRESHRVHLFDSKTLCDQLAESGFRVVTGQSYGSYPLLPRRRAFVATRAT